MKKNVKHPPKQPLKNEKNGFEIKKHKHLIYIAFILLLSFIVFSQSINHDFTNWDDETYIKENSYIKSLSINNIKKIFSEGYFGNYHPLTTLSYAVEYHFFNLKPGGYHFTNIILHLLNILLVFVFIRKFSKSIELPVITAFLFAIHPLHIESVVWVAERKDVLYTLFFLLSLFMYIKHLKDASNLKFYILSIVFFIFSLMSKSAAVVLPLVIIITIYYIQKKILLKDIIKILPFFLLSLLFGVIALKTQDQAIGNLNVLYPGYKRVLIVMYAVYYYVFHFFYPHNFSALHSFPPADINLLPLQYYISPVVLIILVVLYFVINKDFRHHYLFGLLFFIINILLIIQIIPVGQAIVAERYSYMAYIGLSFILAHTFIWLKTYVSEKILMLVFCIYGLFLIYTTWHQVKVWQNSETLWTNVLEVYPNNQIAFNNRGLYRTDREMYKKAFEDFNSLIEINPDYEDVYNNRATACFKIKDYNCVINDLGEAIKRKPNVGKLYNNRGLAKMLINDMTGAIEDYNKAIELSPDYLDAYTNRVTAREAIGDLKGAADDLSIVILKSPRNGDFFNTRGIIYGKMNDFAKALEDFNSAISLKPDLREAYVNKGLALLNLGRVSEACESWYKSLNMGNQNAQAFINQYCK